MREPLAPPVQQRKAAKQPPPKENKITPPDPVLELVERFERNLDEYRRPDYKEARVRAEFTATPATPATSTRSGVLAVALTPSWKRWVRTCATCKGAASTRICPTTRIESPPVWGGDGWLAAGGCAMAVGELLPGSLTNNR